LIYVLDTNSLSNILAHYYPDSFLTFWKFFDEAAADGRLMSVRESKLELEEKFSDEQIKRFLCANGDFFASPSVDELAFITEIYAVPHFQHNLEKKKLLKGGPFADPFIVAKAILVKGVAVTEEKLRPHAAKIPNICDHFGIGCICLKDFFLEEDWKS
jgi:hypothetical protein